MPAGGVFLAAMRVLVTVLDPNSGLAVPGLGPEDFVAPAHVVSVTTAAEPLDILLLLDNSAAGDALQRIARDLTGQLQARDRMALMTFHGDTWQTFTGDAETVRKALAGVTYGGDPRLLDSLAAAVDAVPATPGRRRLILLLTAGIEGPNRTTEGAVAQAAREKGIAIYPVYLHGSGKWSFPGIARQTGGAAFWLREVRTAEGIFAIIRAPYLLTLQHDAPATAIKVKGREKTFVSALPLSNE